MPREYRPPVIGLRGAREVRLSRRLKQRLRRRAERQAAQESDPLIALLRQQKAQLKRQRDKAVTRAENTITSGVDAYSVDRDALRAQGLKGAAIGDVAAEFAARKQDIQQALPSLTQGVRDDFRADIGDVKTSILDAKIGREQTEAELYGSMLGSARTDAQAALGRRVEGRKRQEGRRRAGGAGPRDEGKSNALIAVKNALTSWRKNLPYPDDFEVEEFQGKKPQQLNPLRGTEDLRMFAAAVVDQYEGVSLQDAMWALRRALGGLQAGPPAPGTVRPGSFSERA